MIETNLYYLCPPYSTFTIGDASAVDKIKNVTIHAQDCLDKLVSSLKERAILLLESGRLDSAMKDANIMTQVAPSSALGYLLIGRIYSLGGYYRAAIKNYEYALLRVPSRDPGHEELVNARDTAYVMINKRIDFVSQLPFDVVTHHLIPWIVGNRAVLDIEEPNDYLDVSRIWRQRMALADGLNFHVATNGLSYYGYQRLFEIAPFIKACRIIESLDGSLTEIIDRTRFDSLQRLVIHEPSDQESHSLLSALRTLSRKLTHLEITYGHYNTPCEPYRLYDLLDACPNLKSLRIEHGNIDMSSVTQTYPNLVKLCLTEPHGEVNKDSIMTLLKPLPALRILSMKPSPRPDILPFIDECCPHLQELYLGKHSRSLDSIDIQGHSALRVLHIDRWSLCTPANENDIMRYIKKHSDTLETFELVSGSIYNVPEIAVHQEIKQVTFKQLRRLCYPSCIDQAHIPFILWMVRNAPHLEHLETLAGLNQAPLFHHLVKSPQHNLTKIGMVARADGVSEEKSFIRHHISLGEASSIREMNIFIGFNAELCPWIHLIGKLGQLTILEFSMYANCFDTMGKIFSKLLNDAPALETLIMTSMEDVSFDSLSKMGSHKNLNRIVINAKGVCGSVIGFNMAYKHLKLLHLDIESIGSNELDFLRKGCYHLIYTQRRQPVFNSIMH